MSKPELTFEFIDELKSVIMTYGTLIGELYPVEGGKEVHIRSLVNTDKTNDHFIKGFEAMIQDLKTSARLEEIHAVKIENPKLYRYLMRVYNFEVVIPDEHLKLII